MPIQVYLLCLDSLNVSYLKHLYAILKHFHLLLGVYWTRQNTSVSTFHYISVKRSMSLKLEKTNYIFSPRFSGLQEVLTGTLQTTALLKIRPLHKCNLNQSIKNFYINKPYKLLLNSLNFLLPYSTKFLLLLSPTFSHNFSLIKRKAKELADSVHYKVSFISAIFLASNSSEQP